MIESSHLTLCLIADTNCKTEPLKSKYSCSSCCRSYRHKMYQSVQTFHTQCSGAVYLLLHFLLTDTSLGFQGTSVFVSPEVFISGRSLFGICVRVSGWAGLPRVDEICIGQRLSWVTSSEKCVFVGACVVCAGVDRNKSPMGPFNSAAAQSVWRLYLFSLSRCCYCIVMQGVRGCARVCARVWVCVRCLCVSQGFPAKDR